MSTPLTENEIKRIAGRELSLGWLAECASVYSDVALKMDWHVHAETEFICCLKGEMQYEFKGRPHRTLHAGEFIVIPADVLHRLSSGIDAPSRRVSFLVGGPSSSTHQLSVFSPDDQRTLCRQLLRKRFLPTPFSTDLRHDLLMLGSFLHSGKRCLSSLERCKIRNLCESVLLECASGSQPPQIKPEVLLMDEAIDWMETHYAAHVSLAPLIEHMGYGRSRFFLLFKKKTGLSPNDYLIRLRIRKAKELLAQTDLPVGVIAERVGFRDPAFFSRSFKRLVGLPPKTARSVAGKVAAGNLSAAAAERPFTASPRLSVQAGRRRAKAFRPGERPGRPSP